MDRAEEPVAQREALPKPREPVPRGRDAIRNLDHLVNGGARRLLQLEQEQAGKRRLRALDLRGGGRLYAGSRAAARRRARQTA